MHSPILTNGLIKSVDDIISSLFDVFYKKIQKRNERRIQEICRIDADKAIIERIRVERKRKIFRFFFFLLVSALFAFLVYLFIHLGLSSHPRFYFPLALYFFILFIASFSSMFDTDGNISVFNSLMVLQLEKPFALYLRGFDRDGETESFSEVPIINHLYENGIYTFAVGRPEEVDAPKGALRVYVNNSTWKEEVSILMKCAVCLLVRVRNTESCIWELEQALTMLKKVNIIVDDLNEYKIICQNHPSLPEIDELPESGFVLLS
jgi:hypothetical protein